MQKFVLAFASLAIVSCTAVAERPARTAPSAQSIERDIRYLASDALEGRKTGTDGFRKASQYVADRFASVGLQPGGAGGTFFQPVALRLSEYGDPENNTLVLSGPNAPEQLERFEDYIADTVGNKASGTVEGPLVFVGQGFVDPRSGRNDLAGIDLKGKIAVALSGAPEFLQSEERAYFSGERSRAIAAAGAVGLISLRSEKSEETFAWKSLVDYYQHSSEATWLDADGTPYNELAGLDGYAVLSLEASRRLLKGQPISLDAAFAATNDPTKRIKPFDMGMSARISFDKRFETTTSRNVIGLLPGSDPMLKDEYVVLTAHLDHLGIDETEEGEDRISNGAMDNASGVAMMIDVARRLARNPPRRSVLFIALTAEEEGLIGSSYNAHHPTVPTDAVVADVNLDMPMLNYAFSDVVAYGAERSTLFPAVLAATQEMGVGLADDPRPEEGFFTRSDHYSYVEKGVPSVYLDTGPGNNGEGVKTQFLKDHYHQVSDEADLIDYRQAARFADLNYRIARGIANMDKRPVWKKGDFFGTKFDGPMEP